MLLLLLLPCSYIELKPGWRGSVRVRGGGRAQTCEGWLKEIFKMS